MNHGERRRGGDRRKLTGPQRAAALLIVLGKETTPKLLQHLDRHEVQQIAGAAATLGIVDRTSLDDMIDEFADDFAEGPEIVGTLSEAQQLVSGSLAPQEVAQLVEGESEDALADVWARLDALAGDDVAVLLAREPSFISAIILKKFEPERAAGILDKIEAAQRPRIVAHMLMNRPVSEAAMSLVETAIRGVLGEHEGAADGKGAPARVADVVNRLDGNAIDDVISYLSAVAPDKAAEMRALVFKFEQLTELAPQDRTKVFDGLPTERVILALKEAPEDIVEAALSSLGARARRLVESELSSNGNAPLREVQAARRMIVQAALRLSAAGAISLPQPNPAE